MNSRLSIFAAISFVTIFFGCSGNQNKPEKKDDIFPPEKFSVLKARFNGKPVIGSINQGYANYQRKKEYPWCLILTIGLNLDSVYANGLPFSEESQIAYREEDEFVTAIKNITTAHYIGHLFNDGFLDVYIYLDDPKAINAFLQTEKDKPELKRGIGFKITKDPDWVAVSSMMK